MEWQQQEELRVEDSTRKKQQMVDWQGRRGGVEAGKIKLQIVDLSGMCLDELPNPSINLSAICKLDLSNNNLQSIPESLTARLLNMVVLDVHSNQLKNLPNSIGCLSKLKTLNVSANFLQYIPSTIHNCRCLEELNANFNKLSHLPETMGFELRSLKMLSVNSNKLAQLPRSTSHLTNLLVLDARLNCLRSLPDNLENLINLRVLNVSQNFHYLTTLPFSIGLLMSLVELDISYNSITALPDSMAHLYKLHKLSVEGNPLLSPPMSVAEQGWPLVKLYLRDKINGKAKNSVKKSSWFGKLAKCHHFSGGKVGFSEREEEMQLSYMSIDSMASPTYMEMFYARQLSGSKS